MNTPINTESPGLSNKKEKKYVQQAFHPSLLTRTRSASVGNLPTTASEKEDPKEDQGITIQPEWQRAPVNRNPNKKRKISSILSPETVPTSNRADLHLIEIRNL
ncbi:hypothetical protein ACJJTC_009274 [Scirpophaga incertulas]